MQTSEEHFKTIVNAKFGGKQSARWEIEKKRILGMLNRCPQALDINGYFIFGRSCRQRSCVVRAAETLDSF